MQNHPHKVDKRYKKIQKDATNDGAQQAAKDQCRRVSKIADHRQYSHSLQHNDARQNTSSACHVYHQQRSKTVRSESKPTVSRRRAV